MKKAVVCFILVFMISLSGCFTYHYIEAEPGSKWVSEDSMIYFEIVSDGKAQGTLVVKDETINIDCFFGPGKTDFAVHKQDDSSADSCLMKGDYRYDKKKEIITFTIVEDYVGLDKDVYVFVKESA